MRKSFILFFYFVICLPCLQAQEKTIVADSKIERVIVFLPGAQLERSGRASLPAGSSSIVFKGLSPDIEEQSIQVKGEGSFTTFRSGVRVKRTKQKQQAQSFIGSDQRATHTYLIEVIIVSNSLLIS